MDDATNITSLHEPLPERARATIRAMYAGPADEAYWRSLEARIMARIAATGEGIAARWWLVVGGWARAGLVAAAAAVILAAVGSVVLQTRERDAALAYEAASGPATDTVGIPTGALSERDDPDARGATFRDVISR